MSALPSLEKLLEEAKPGLRKQAASMAVLENLMTVLDAPADARKALALIMRESAQQMIEAADRIERGAQ